MLDQIGLVGLPPISRKKLAKIRPFVNTSQPCQLHNAIVHQIGTEWCRKSVDHIDETSEYCRKRTIYAENVFIDDDDEQCSEDCSKMSTIPLSNPLVSTNSSSSISSATSTNCSMSLASPNSSALYIDFNHNQSSTSVDNQYYFLSSNSEDSDCDFSVANTDNLDLQYSHMAMLDHDLEDDVFYDDYYDNKYFYANKRKNNIIESVVDEVDENDYIDEDNEQVDEDDEDVSDDEPNNQLVYDLSNLVPNSFDDRFGFRQLETIFEEDEDTSETDSIESNYSVHVCHCSDDGQSSDVVPNIDTDSLDSVDSGKYTDTKPLNGN